jgi:hypothetical protein
MQAKFILMNETKGALRYAEMLPNNSLAQYPNSPGAKIGTLYVRKTAFNSGGASGGGPEANYPKQILVTIEEVS